MIVTDEFPCFFLPRMVAAAGAKMPVLLEQVDSNGLAAAAGGSEGISDSFFVSALPAEAIARASAECRRAPIPSTIDECKAPRLKALPESAILRRWPMAALDVRAIGASANGSRVARRKRGGEEKTDQVSARQAPLLPGAAQRARRRWRRAGCRLICILAIFPRMKFLRCRKEEAGRPRRSRCVPTEAAPGGGA